MSSLYVKGSYVLDVVFGRDCARDIDVFHPRDGLPPTDAAIRKWQATNKFPGQKKPISKTPVDELEKCNGGGSPFLNVDQWHLCDGGKLWTLEYTRKRVKDLESLWNGGATRATRRVRLELAKARKAQMIEVLDLDTVTQDQQGQEYLGKALDKMRLYPALHNAQLQKRIGKLLKKRRS